MSDVIVRPGFEHVPFMCGWCMRPVEWFDLTSSPFHERYRLRARCHGWESITIFDLRNVESEVDFVIFKRPVQLNFNFEKEAV